MLLDFLPTGRRDISSMAKRIIFLDFFNTDSNVPTLGTEREIDEARKPF